MKGNGEELAAREPRPDRSAERVRSRGLPYFPIHSMIYHMKTTLIIPDHLLRRLKRRAADSGRTLSAVVAEALRRGLVEPQPGGELPPLPVHRMGRPKVDVADRNAVYRVMEGR